MSLVSLGSCLFSICSAFAFVSGPMNWDASRVSAAIPSGVGFLGSALIFKHTANDDGGDGWHEVHGLTTAASVWLSAAVGIACAGGLYFVASLSTAIVLVMLRFGPRTNSPVYGFDDEEFNGEGSDVESEAGDNVSVISLSKRSSYQTLPIVADPEMQAMIPPMKQSSSRRSLLHSKGLSNRKLRPSLI